MSTYDTELHALSGGHTMLALCCVCYLAWWCIFFRPRASKPQGLEYGIGVALLLGAIVFGVLAVVRMVGALSALPNRIPGIVLWPCAAVVYLVLAYVTWRFMKRPITTELILIAAWTALEVSVVGAVWGTGITGMTWLMFLLVAVACIGSLACYLAYYQLTGFAAFLDGCGPLVAIGVLSVAFSLLI